MQGGDLKARLPSLRTSQSRARSVAASEGWEDTCGVCLDSGGPFVALNTCGHKLCGELTF